MEFPAQIALRPLPGVQGPLPWIHPPEGGQHTWPVHLHWRGGQGTAVCKVGVEGAWDCGLGVALGAPRWSWGWEEEEGPAVGAG